MPIEPRDYQLTTVKSAHAALKKHGNTLAVLPTGSGKSMVSGFLIEEELRHTPEARFLVLQPSEELLKQNKDAIESVIPSIATSVVKAEQNDWSGRVIVASPHTVGRKDRLGDLPNDITHVIVDEADTMVTQLMANIDGALRSRGPIKLFGMTATPGPGMRTYYNNICHQIPVKEMIRRGILVPPRCLGVDLGIPLNDLPVRGDSDEAMKYAEALLNTRIHNGRVVDVWEEHARNEVSVFYATRVKHAMDLAEEFQARGHEFRVIWGEQPKNERRDTIDSFKAGRFPGLINALSLIAGFDHQVIKCIGNVRPLASQRAFSQVLGRGMRKVDPERFPGVIKKDFLFLDFCGAAALHGTVEYEVDLDAPMRGGAVSKYKQCPSCYGYVPAGARRCDLCEHVWHVEVGEDGRPKIITEFNMTEFDILNASPFKYVSVAEDDSAMVATAFTAWAGVFFDGVNWHAVGRRKLAEKQWDRVRHIGIGTRVQAVATADDFLRQYGDKKMARKNKRWLSEEASDAQKELLRRAGYNVGLLDFSYSKYRASVLLEFQWAKQQVIKMVYGC